MGQVFWNIKPHYSYFLTPSICGETTFSNSNKRKDFSNSSSILTTKQTTKHQK